jgi:hypothetical protein
MVKLTAELKFEMPKIVGRFITESGAKISDAPLVIGDFLHFVPTNVVRQMTQELAGLIYRQAGIASEELAAVIPIAPQVDCYLCKVEQAVSTLMALKRYPNWDHGMAVSLQKVQSMRDHYVDSFGTHDVGCQGGSDAQL